MVSPNLVRLLRYDFLHFSLGSIMEGTFAKYSDNKMTVCDTCSTIELNAVAGKTLNANSMAKNNITFNTNGRFVLHIKNGIAWKYHE